ncbi:hypothetical protein PYJP_06330 [Pyrofollis japonicus]|nr:hypothetical protein PYJP_06330 [Pyrofollis japonicus]
MPNTRYFISCREETDTTGLPALRASSLDSSNSLASRKNALRTFRKPLLISTSPETKTFATLMKRCKINGDVKKHTPKLQGPAKASRPKSETYMDPAKASISSLSLPNKTLTQSLHPSPAPSHLRVKADRKAPFRLLPHIIGYPAKSR